MKKILFLSCFVILSGLAQADSDNFAVGNASSASPVIFTCLPSGQQLNVVSDSSLWWPKSWQYCSSSNDANVSATNTGTSQILLLCQPRSPWNPWGHVIIAPGQTASCPPIINNVPWVAAATIIP
ncbi:MAG: hypothetical protein ORN24_02815 [Burkholderiales bacterium]|nr:hypothetical protein [Burkholderiales bacterium]